MAVYDTRGAPTRPSQNPAGSGLALEGAQVLAVHQTSLINGITRAHGRAPMARSRRIRPTTTARIHYNRSAPAGLIVRPSQLNFHVADSISQGLRKLANFDEGNLDSGVGQKRLAHMGGQCL